MATARPGVTLVTNRATILAGNASVAVTHGIGSTPSEVMMRVFPLQDLGGRSWWHGPYNNTTFYINIDAPDIGNLLFRWVYRVE